MTNNNGDINDPNLDWIIGNTRDDWYRGALHAVANGNDVPMSFYGMAIRAVTQEPQVQEAMAPYSGLSGNSLVDSLVGVVETLREQDADNLVLNDLGNEIGIIQDIELPYYKTCKTTGVPCIKIGSEITTDCSGIYPFDIKIILISKETSSLLI